MKKRAAGTVLRVLLLFSLAASASAPAATIPPDLEARATEFRRQASPQLLAWAHDRGVALARAHGPVNLAPLEQSIRSQFAVKRAPAGKPATGPGAPTYSNLGAMGDGDIMALVFIVLMEAAKSAQEDLKAIMAHVKAANSAKAGQRKTLTEVNQPASSRVVAPTPTPAPDRVSQLVAAARSIQGRTAGANLSPVVRR